MPIYETVFMARQDLSETQVKQMTESFEKIITDNGGKIFKTEHWGLRKLAYRINKARNAHYVLIETDAPAPAVIEMERNLRLNEDVVRSLTVRRDEHSKGPSVILDKNRDEREFGSFDRPDRPDRFDRSDRPSRNKEAA